MKVAYNNCYGGFGLSPLAETEYSKKKGITLTWYEGIGGYPYKAYRKVTDISGLHGHGLRPIALMPSNTDLGDTLTEIPSANLVYRLWRDDENRADPDLIEVIERLGDKADGCFASLAIKEVPDGSEFEITEYDGNEDVVPPRMSW